MTAQSHFKEDLESHSRLFVDAMERLPYWARSTNPIVRRHLGLYWRTLPPVLRPIALSLVGWTIVLLSTIPIPFVWEIILPMMVLALLSMPVVFLLFGHILLTVALTASNIMQEEYRNNTINLLLATPMSINQILLGKVSAAIWKRMDDLMIVLYVTSLTGVTILIMTYKSFFPPEEDPVILPFILIVGLVVSVIRPVLEVIMVGAVSVCIGIAVPFRSLAVTSAVVLNGFYFVFINLARHIPQVQEDVRMVLFLDFVLALVIPLILIFIALKLSAYLIEND
ncbi:hypothetical protein MASR2M15_24110 [Anaerolineales bacterium]